MLPDHVDVLIVGGGPAGTACLRTFQTLKPDLSVLLVDKRAFPRDKVCGDALTFSALPLTLRIFPELRLLLPKHSRTRTFTLRYPNGAVLRKTDTDGLDVIPRHTYDWMLWNAVQDGPMRAVAPCAVEDVVYAAPGGEHRVTLSHDGAQHTLSARWLLAADGGRSRIRRAHGGFPRATISTAVRQYVKGVPTHHSDDDGLVFFIDPDHRGYFWFFPVTIEGVPGANIGWVSIDPSRHANPRARFEAMCRRYDVRTYLGEASFAGRLKGAPIPLACPTLRRVTPSAPVFGDQLLFLGDAAGLVQPFTGEGITAALASGVCAAEALAGGHPPERVGPVYQDALLTFMERHYALWQTALVFQVPCFLPPAARDAYTTLLPNLLGAIARIEAGADRARTALNALR